MSSTCGTDCLESCAAEPIASGDPDRGLEGAHAGRQPGKASSKRAVSSGVAGPLNPQKVTVPSDAEIR